MRQLYVRLGLCAAIVVNVAVSAVPANAQTTTNPYRAIYAWEKLPKGREALGVVAGIYTDPDKSTSGYSHGAQATPTRASRPRTTRS